MVARLYFAILLIVILISAVAESAYCYKVVVPDNTRVKMHSRRPFLHVVVRANSGTEAKQIRLEVIKRRSKNIEVKRLGAWEKNGKIYLHFKLPLSSGRNRFVINPGDRSLSVLYTPLRTLLNMAQLGHSTYEYHKNGKEPLECGQCHGTALPKDVTFKLRKNLRQCEVFTSRCYSCHRDLIEDSKWTHSPAANLYCGSCHDLGPNNNNAKHLINTKIDQSCFQCHVTGRKWGKMSHVHGPVGTGDCTVCHDPHGEKYQYQLWANGKAEICVTCHTNKEKLIKNTPLGFRVHGIVIGGGCIACHSPHASENRFQLYKPINDLCVGCHVSMRGIIVGHPVGGHPVRGKKDPRRKGRELSCTSCHNPHGSNFIDMLIGDLLGGHVCSKCHK